MEPSGGFLRVSGRSIVDEQGRAVSLRGVAFGNEVWSNGDVPNAHHTQVDFERVVALGFNSIRFYLHYGFFERDSAPYQYRASGFSWLDENVAWAKEQGVRLILNLHVPQGGFQSLGQGSALWTDAENQNRLIALWRAIAERYRDEPAVAGYGLLNEPSLEGPKSEWQSLAERITVAIREVDERHIVFVERPIRAGGSWEIDAEQNFVRIEDANVVYEFHSYDPFEYTHQLFSWAGNGGMGDGGKYPDPSRVSGIGLKWEDWSSSVQHAAVPAGDSDFTYYETGLVAPTDPSYAAIVPVLASDNNAGTVIFDDVVLSEYDASGALVREAVKLDFESPSTMSFWSEDGVGTMNVSAEGRSGGKGLSISGTTSYANANDWTLLVPIVPGHQYRIGGYVRGEGVASGAEVQIRMDFLSGTVRARDKELLRGSLAPIVAWAEEHGVPLYAGEFGAGIHCFQNDKGGVAWVSDMLDLYEEYGLPWNYHTYHEDAFGIFIGTNQPIDPERVNAELRDFFMARYATAK